MIDQSMAVWLVVCALALLLSVLFTRIVGKMEKGEKKRKGLSFLTVIFQLIAVFSGWRFGYLFLNRALGVEDKGTLISAQLIAFGTILVIVILFAIIVRKVLVPKYKMNPDSAQNLMEASISKIYKHSKKGELSSLSDDEIKAYVKKRMESRKKWRRRINITVIVAALWLLLSLLIKAIFPPIQRSLHFELLPGDVQIANGIAVSETAISLSILTMIIIVLALLLYVFVIRNFREEKPSGLQQGLEMAIEGIQNYSRKMSGIDSPMLPKYIFGLTVFLLFSAMTDFFGIRPPTTDLRLTGLLALLTFIMLNYYGLRKKGFAGRMKALASPSPVIMPIRIMSDIASPVSLACRLFGNMVGGMIVMELLYVFLGNFAIGIPAVLGLYFSVFEPVIQIYIFITLTLNYIREATE